MHDPNEELLQFIWKNRLLNNDPVVSVNGASISILSPGELNRDAGPDFSNARIVVNGVQLAGNVELHIRTSDWLKHGHQHDMSYDRIILHAVYEHDVEVPQNATHMVEVIELKKLIRSETLLAYEGMMKNGSALACDRALHAVEPNVFSEWIGVMALQRLQDKATRVQHVFGNTGGDYPATFYQLIIRNFGLFVNTVPFELLGNSLPLSLLLRHADNIIHLEALLLGTAGQLEDRFSDSYIRQLQNEYAFLSRKYGIRPVEGHLFKFHRMRPSNFPTVRLAQFAMLIHRSPSLFSQPFAFTDFDNIRSALSVSPSPYWQSRYSPDGTSHPFSFRLGNNFAENIIINTFSPFLYFYGQRTARQDITELGRSLQLRARAEFNFKTRKFTAKKKAVKNAADSQGLIHLHDRYCASKKCLACGIGRSILRPV